MTRLSDRLSVQIADSGPIGISDYMAQCLFDPQDGYYTTREPFGAAGDFVTAPEMSQLFGELVGVWIRVAWEAIGSPTHLTIAEIGPGRGTLMKDILRTLAKVDPALFANADIALVETSPRLRATQEATLAGCGKAVAWHADMATLPARPLIIVGNELFDAIPIRQYQKTHDAWRERLVGLDTNGSLGFIAGPGTPDPALLPKDAIDAPEGSVVEIAPARSALMETIATRIAEDGGCGLFIDYGHPVAGFGDTFQAVRDHRHESVFANPGIADLTAHVDFAALAAAARSAGLDAHLTTQGDFLLAMGLLERAGRLGAQATQAGRETIHAAVERLAGSNAMGELFKVLAVAPKDVAIAPFGSPD